MTIFSVPAPSPFFCRRSRLDGAFANLGERLRDCAERRSDHPGNADVVHSNQGDLPGNRLAMLQEVFQHPDSHEIILRPDRGDIGMGGKEPLRAEVSGLELEVPLEGPVRVNAGLET